MESFKGGDTKGIGSTKWTETSGEAKDCSALATGCGASPPGRRRPWRARLLGRLHAERERSGRVVWLADTT
uniref:Uncharacterized protein n=1 Tax=Leersia perrieri TaxID=77586 RepID=A0A0D9XUD1_9ORYZ